MNAIRKMFFASATVAMISLAACFGGGSSGSADSGLTQSQVQALITAALAPVKVMAFRPLTAAELARTESIALPGQPRTAAAAPSTAAGVIAAYDPSSQNQVATLQTTAGNYYRVIYTTGQVLNLASGSLFFTTTDCSGTPYLTSGPNNGDSLPAGTTNVGHVFAYGGAMWMLAAGATAASQNVLSNFSGGVCSPVSFSGVSFYTAIPNTDPQVPGPSIGPLSSGAPH